MGGWVGVGHRVGFFVVQRKVCSGMSSIDLQDMFTTGEYLAKFSRALVKLCNLSTLWPRSISCTMRSWPPSVNNEHAPRNLRRGWDVDLDVKFHFRPMNFWLLT